MRVRAGVYDHRIAHMSAHVNEDPRGTQKRSSFDEIIAEHEPARALSCHLMAVFAARTPCSRYPRFMARPGLNPYAAFG